jgi:hypothetical protein
VTLSLVTDLRLPPMWDGLRVDWTLQRNADRIFICPPPPMEERFCTSCGAEGGRTAWSGLVHPPDGETMPLEKKIPMAGGRSRTVTVQVPAWPVIGLIAWRCGHCHLDEVWDMRSNEVWTLGPEDYGPAGSTPPAAPAVQVLELPPPADGMLW